MVYKYGWSFNNEKSYNNKPNTLCINMNYLGIEKKQLTSKSIDLHNKVNSKINTVNLYRGLEPSVSDEIK